MVSIVRHSFMRICSMSMFCEDTHICKRITNEIINTIVNINMLESKDEIKYVLYKYILLNV